MNTTRSKKILKKINVQDFSSLWDVLKTSSQISLDDINYMASLNNIKTKGWTTKEYACSELELFTTIPIDFTEFCTKTLFLCKQNKEFIVKNYIINNVSNKSYDDLLILFDNEQELMDTMLKVADEHLLKYMKFPAQGKDKNYLFEMYGDFVVKNWRNLDIKKDVLLEWFRYKKINSGKDFLELFP